MDPTLENNPSNNYPKYWSDYLMDSPEFGELYAEIKNAKPISSEQNITSDIIKEYFNEQNILTKSVWIWRNTINKSLDCKLSW